MKLLDTNRYYLKNTNNRFVHIATVQSGLRDFMAFFDLFQRKLYIEEITAGSLTFIEDDKLAQELSDFLFEKNVTNVKYGDLVPDIKG